MSITASSCGDVTPALQLGVLGSFQACIGGQWQAAPTRQVARVATVLAGWPGEPIERDQIVAAVWGEITPATVTNTLQVHVSHLRRMIGRDAVRSQGTSYLLDVAPEAVDAEQFVEAVHEAARMRRRLHFGRASELLDTATRLWRGTPFPDIVDPDLEARRAKLTELRDQAREDLLECRLELARDKFELADVIAEAKELVTRQPLREKGHVLLVRSLAAADRTSEASAAFDEAQQRTRDTMGMDPGRELVTVHTQVLHRDDALLPRAMRSISVLPRDRPTTDRVDRLAERARDAVVDLGADTVTVICPEDVDRHGLAVAIGYALEADMPTGVLLVPEQQATLTGLTKALDDANGGDLATLVGRETLAVIVEAGSGAKHSKLARLGATFAEWSARPRLLVVGDRPLGIDTEVVISSDSPMAAVPERRGA